MNNKKCSKCGETKPLAEFHKNIGNADGHRGHCKRCRNATVKAWREANKERKAATNKAWYESNKERKAATAKAWHEDNPDKVKARLERAKERWPEKVAARKVVNDATRSGKLIRQPCEVCGALEVHGHHDDYSQPLVVRWLCLKHHTEHHMESMRCAQ